MPFRRRTGVISALAAVAVVTLLAAAFFGLLIGYGRGPASHHTGPIAVTGGWETLDRLKVQTVRGSSGAPAIAPSDPRVVYETINSQDATGNFMPSLRRTDNEGRTWRKISLPMTSSKHIRYIGVFVSPLDPDSVYLHGLDESGVGCAPGQAISEGVGCFEQFFSSDAGMHWTPVKLPVPGVLSDAMPLLAQGSRLYATSVCGSVECTRLLTSTDGGATWTVADAYLASQNQGVCDIAAAAIGTTVFAASSTGNCSRLDQHARTLWRSDDAGAHWTKLGMLPTPNEQGLFAVSRGAGQQPLLYITLPKTTGHQTDKEDHPQPVISASPSDVMVSDDGGKTWKSAPAAGIPAGQVRYPPAFGTLADGSIVVPFADAVNGDTGMFPSVTLYLWKPNATSWTQLVRLPHPGTDYPVSYLVTQASPSAKATLWVAFYNSPEATVPTPHLSGTLTPGQTATTPDVIKTAYWVARYVMS